MDAFVKRKKPDETSDNDSPKAKKSPTKDRDQEISLLQIPFKTLLDEKALEAHFVKLAEVRFLLVILFRNDQDAQ